MPILPPLLIAPYDPVETVLTFARVIINDCEVSVAGDLLSDAQPGTLPTLNLAWRKLQDRLANNAVEEFPQEAILTGLPSADAVASLDPATQTYVDFGGYFDGATYHQSVGYCLPQDLQIPQKLWERPTGQNAFFVEVVPVVDLPTRPTSGMYQQWQWRDDKIYLPCSNQSNDLRIRYKRFIKDAVNTTQTLSVMRCAVALSYLTAEIVVTGHGGTLLPAISGQKEDAIKQLINNTTRKKQGQNFRRQPYSRRGRRLFW